jgi:hypothetical protein
MTTRDATTTLFSLSVLTATKGNASKRLIPASVDNGPIKDPTHTLGISTGCVEHAQVAGLAGLRDLLQRITPKQALVHGVPKGSNPGDVLHLVLADKYSGAPGTVARTLTCIDYPPGVRLMMCDYDPAPEAPETMTSAGELIARLTGIWPAFAEAGWLATTSTSSAIRDKQTQAWLKPPAGMHVYLLVTGNITRFREQARVRLWLAGTGYCKLATPNKDTGVASLLERCLIDLTVLSPERLDYVAGALIPPGAPFYQDCPAPELHPGLVLDLEASLRSLTTSVQRIPSWWPKPAPAWLPSNVPCSAPVSPAQRRRCLIPRWSRKSPPALRVQTAGNSTRATPSTLTMAQAARLEPSRRPWTVNDCATPWNPIMDHRKRSFIGTRAVRAGVLSPGPMASRTCIG